MIQPMDIIYFFISHQYFVPFLSGFITEEVLIITTIISGDGAIPFYFILLFGFLGIVASDIFWFLIIKFKPLMKFSTKVGRERKKIASKTPFSGFPPPTQLPSYIFTKFTFGLRSWGIFYCSVHKMPLRKFILHTTIASAVYVLIMLTLAKLFGKWLYVYFRLTQNIGGVIVFVFAAIILWVFMSKFAYRILKRHSKN